MKYKGKSSTFFDRVLDTCATIAALIIMAMLLFINTSVVARWLFNTTWEGVFEIAETSLVYITFLVAAWVLRKDRHVALDTLTLRLNTRSRIYTNIITSIFCACICFLIFWFGLIVTLERYQQSFLNYYYLEYLLDWYVIITIPIGFFLLFIQFLRRTVVSFENLKSEKSATFGGFQDIYIDNESKGL